MVIEKIIIKSFGLITDMTLEFSESVNVIEGQNESGKSTIAAFIKYMLYGFDDGESEEAVSERKKRINWYTGVAQGAMYVRVKNKRYLINRSTTPTEGAAEGRETYKEESSIIDLETGAPAFGKLAAGEVFFGVDRELFDNTAFIGRIGDSRIDEGAVKESIENILFSGSEKINNQRAAAKVADKMQALLSENGTGGAILDLAGRESELEAKLEEANKDNHQVLVKEAELHDIKRRRAETEEKQAKLYELDACYGNVMMIQTFDQLHNLEEECEEKERIYNQFIDDNTKAGFVPDEQYFVDLNVARKGVSEAYHSLGDAQDAYSEQRRAIGITKEIENAIKLSDENGGEDAVLSSAMAYTASKMKFAAGAIGCALAVIAAVVALVVVPIQAIKILVGIMGAIALAAAGALTFMFAKSHKSLVALEGLFGTSSLEDLKGKIAVVAEARSKRDAMIVANDNAKLAVERARERYEAAKQTLADLIMKWGEEPPASDLSIFLDRLEDKVSNFLDKKNQLYDEKVSIEITVREIRRTLSAKSEIDVRAQVSPLKRKALAGINHDDIINGIADSKAKIAEEDRLAFEVENELSILKSRSSDPGEYHSRIHAVASRREELQEKHKAYFMAYQAISGASDNLRAEISPRLGEYSTALMSVMTDEKYTDFDVSDGLKVTFADPNGDKKSVDFLSGGTKELTYVAVRAALIDMLYTEKPPICFDETFAHQDNLRARSMMRGIKQLSEEGCQSFIFTCRGREATIANELVKGASVFKLSVMEDEKA
ncbi:MAG: AAA family ATPase [Clostridia bacterium]|nr:AAA family ATPase [Clostridia bacterium]